MSIDISIVSIGMAFGAGLASVLSPCVLPVLPIVVAGTEKDHRLRPILLALGLSLSFVAMGVVSSLAGGWLAGKMRFVEIIAGILVGAMGLLMVLGIDAFKRLSFFQRLSPKAGAGPFSGFALGMALGLVWIPCVGPFLSSVLAMVAAKGQLLVGVVLLLGYSLGFAVPVLAAGYASRWFRGKAQGLRSMSLAVRVLGGLLLMALGWLIATQGSYGLGSLSL